MSKGISVTCPSTSVLRLFHDRLLGGLDGKRVVFLDVPIYRNFGDTLIYLGARKILESLNVADVRYFSAHEILSNPRLIADSDVDVIVMLGGGNFGDVYKLHQQLRLMIIENFPNLPKILLPQSVHYNNEVSRTDRDAFGNAENLTLYVRDKYSQSLVFSEFGISAEIFPDTAHFLNSDLAVKATTAGTARDGKKALQFYRRDTESSAMSREAQLNEQSSIDWKDLYSIPEAALIRVLPAVLRASSRSPRALHLLHRLWHAYVRRKFKRVQSLFLRYEKCETDRLHVAILSTMLGVDVVAYDNHYGKLARYFEAVTALNSSAQ